MHEHDGYAPHSHEVRADHRGVKMEDPVAEELRQAVGDARRYERILKAGEIVAGLAKCEEPVDQERLCCMLCGAPRFSKFRPPVRHRESCPWKMARDMHGRQ